MRAATKRHLVMAIASLFLLCIMTDLTAQDIFNPTLTQHENQKRWVCDYTRKNDVLLLRCDDLVGLLYDRILLNDEPQSETTLFIPIWNRAANDDSAINLVKILLCKDETECSVEMQSVWASNM